MREIFMSGFDDHRNFVTEAGLAAIEAVLGRFEAAHRAATDKGDREAAAAALRQVRCPIAPSPASNRMHAARSPLKIPIAKPAARPTERTLPRFRALALFGRRSPERAARSSSPASENLHKIGH